MQTFIVYALLGKFSYVFLLTNYKILFREIQNVNNSPLYCFTLASTLELLSELQFVFISGCISEVVAKHVARVGFQPQDLYRPIQEDSEESMAQEPASDEKIVWGKFSTILNVSIVTQFNMACKECCYLKYLFKSTFLSGFVSAILIILARHLHENWPYFC